MRVDGTRQKCTGQPYTGNTERVVPLNPRADSLITVSSLCRHHSSRNRSQNTILVIPGLEERVAQRDCINPPHTRILGKLGINEEEHRHIDRLALIQLLLLEAETLDLAKVRRDLGGCDAVCGDANDICLALVGGGKEGECGLAGEDADFALLRDEAPGEDVGDAAVEGDAEATVVFERFEAHGGIGFGTSGVVGFDGLAGPAGLLADHFVEGDGAVCKGHRADD